MITVTEGQQVGGVDIRLVPPRYTIVGSVRHAQDGRLRGVQIEYGYAEGRQRSLLTVTAPDGRFTISDRNLRPGPLTLFAHGMADDGEAAGV